mmetsp:Transcript_5907/g.6146  ORF Transcript_5907/g.6146 Transcript_5907/m.6146 type:complete len:253 (+) Transcript_5907:978-1736(+)
MHCEYEKAILEQHHHEIIEYDRLRNLAQTQLNEIERLSREASQKYNQSLQRLERDISIMNMLHSNPRFNQNIQNSSQDEDTNYQHTQPLPQSQLPLPIPLPQSQQSSQSQVSSLTQRSDQPSNAIVIRCPPSSRHSITISRSSTFRNNRQLNYSHTNNYQHHHQHSHLQPQPQQYISTSPPSHPFANKQPLLSIVFQTNTSQTYSNVPPLPPPPQHYYQNSYFHHSPMGYSQHNQNHNHNYNNTRDIYIPQH